MNYVFGSLQHRGHSNYNYWKVIREYQTNIVVHWVKKLVMPASQITAGLNASCLSSDPVACQCVWESSKRWPQSFSLCYPCEYLDSSILAIIAIWE